ncbi:MULTISPECIES: alpha/beta hydrolase [unclassified Streptomyces]|uniref:alpha/beta fold hydrolase n=1 Tax=unclassified Streptomyces TaxID=2593676 RepID=UPI0006FD4A04|nr:MULTISPECIES: alpha/beta hydrolase [unclassified Streptomyces]KQX59041.1 alpha/beta hydrolase [Streptomyces sp. Root1304]KRB00303.1 alpha/beta hydrolase [Streptomyces sp. Root66D1]
MTLSHDTAGHGPSTVLLLHSGVCDRRMWDGQFQALAEAGHRVVRCDLRGFGESPVDARHTHADDVRDLLDHLGADRAAVVGSSFGGCVALEFAARNPGRVSALALLGSNIPGFAPSDELRAWGAREDALLDAGDLDAAVELNVDTWLGPDAGPEARALVRAMQRRAFDVQLAAPEEFHPVDPEVTRDELAGIAVPALVASGGHDVPDFRAVADDLAGLLPAARRVDLDWAGHLPALERPAETARLLTDFLKETL